MNLTGIVSRFDTVLPGSGPNRLRLTQTRALKVEQVLPEYAEMVRAGLVFNAFTGAGTAIAPVAAMPTTAAAWALYNPPDSGVIVIPLFAFCYSVSGTLGLGMSLIAAVDTKPIIVVANIPTDYSGSVKSGASGKLSGATKTIFAQGVTLAGSPAWQVLASRDQVSAISVGSGLVAETKGRLMARPGIAIGGSVLAPVGTTALFGFGFVWGEVQLNLD